MKIFRSFMSLIGMMGMMACLHSCTEWGKADPEAGNQVYPTRQSLGSSSFKGLESLADAEFITSYGGETAEVVYDDSLRQEVLHLNKAYAAIDNPLTAVKLQTGAAVSLWVKTDGRNLDDRVFTFAEDEDSQDAVSFTTGGSLVYPAGGVSIDMGQLPDSLFTPGKWHFVAVQMNATSSTIYLDGELWAQQSYEQTPGTEAMVERLNNAPSIIIGGTADGDLCVEKLTVIRNSVNANDIKRPNVSGGGSDADFEFIIGDPIITIGAEDNSAGWWTTWSNYFRIPGGKTMHLRFINYGTTENNWNNWNLCVSTDADRGGDGYLEYFVIRSDLYGWGSTYDGANFSNTGYFGNAADDWALFRESMNGAVVDMTIRRDGTETYVTAVQTCPDGRVYVENFHADTGDANEPIRAFLICDGSHFVLQPDGCYVESELEVATTEVGAADNSAGWWTVWSDYFTIPAGYNLHLGFTNYGTTENNWNNWNLCVTTDADRGGDGYLEYFVIRSDLYGWGSTYDGANFSNTGYFENADDDWALFRESMNGAEVSMYITRNGTESYVSAVQTCPDGRVYVEDFHADTGDANEPIRAFLICDGSHFVMHPADCYLYIPFIK